jgi:hypothetical protein
MQFSRLRGWFGGLLAAIFVCGWAFGDDPAADREGIEFFEKKIRPVLAERCYPCHSSEAPQLEGALSVETRAGLLKGGDQGKAVVPGDVEASLLIRAIRYTDKDLQMPPKEKGQLSAEQVADFEAWVKRGAPDPRGQGARSQGDSDIEAAKQRWPFAAVKEPAIPMVKDASWPRNAADNFVLAKLEEKGLKPAGDADKRALIRRLTYDLTGLPPLPEDVDAFVAACSPSLGHSVPPSDQDGETERQRDREIKAYEAYVERLLGSAAYGERWGRHWLDVVRYADTAGDNSDYPIPQMYKYRNWVIRAVNDDMPYDEFIRQQLAGDLLPAGSTAEKHEQIIATGYIANARRFGSRVSDYPQHLTIEDTIDNLGRAFLGVSLNCARCHNHKFDPFTTEDYYAIYGIFHSTQFPWPGIELEKKQRDLVPLADEQVVTAAMAERKKQVEVLAAELKACDDAKKAGDALAVAAADRLAALKQQEIAAEQLAEAEKEVEDAKKQAAELDKRAKATKKKKTDFENTEMPFDTAYAIAEGKKFENCKVQLKGDPERLGVEVPRRFPLVLGGQSLGDGASGSGRRELAEWIASKDNPLTARVMVNRLWHHHFGRGIVPTPNDFGKQGKAATHPELHDYLALRFIESDWSLKAMHRLMVLSRTYQMASASQMTNDQEPMTKQIPNPKSQIPNGAVVDPGNELLWRFNRRRLDAESIRDTLLVLGGNLDATMGQGHPFPPQPAWDFTQHKPFKAVYDTNRRSVYLMTQRIQRHPLMAIFDGPDTGASTGSRPTSTTTLQALYFLNDPFVHEQADKLAARLMESRSDDEARIALAYELCFCRPASEDEVTQGLDYLRKIDSPAEAWKSFVRVLLRSNEFVYLD